MQLHASRPGSDLARSLGNAQLQNNTSLFQTAFIISRPVRGGKRRKHTRGRVNRAVEEIFRRRCAHFLLQLQTIRQKRIFRHNFLHNKEKKTRILVEMPFFECKNCKPH